MYLCMDIGSTYIKFAVIDTSYGVLKHCRVPSPEREGTGHVFEVSSSAYLNIMLDKLDKTLDEGYDIRSLLISTQMHGFVLKDRYISWQDTECLDVDHNEGITYLDKLRAMIPEDLLSKSGVHLKPSLGMCNLYARVSKSEVKADDQEIYTLGSWLISQLTGNNICHISNAAPLGLVDLASKNWNEDLIALLGLTGFRLPAIAEDDYIPCGYFERKGKRMTVYPDYGDQQVSVLGTSPTSQDVIVNVATAAQIISISEHPIDVGCENRPYFDGKYLNVITNLPSGRNLQLIIGFIKQAVLQVTGREVTEAEIWETINADVPAEGLKVDPRFFLDQGCEDGGTISCIRSDNFSPDTMLSSTLSAMAEIYGMALRSLKPDEQTHHLICIGGVVRKNRSLVSRLELLTGKPCVIPDLEDESLNGFIKIIERCEERHEQGI